VYRVKGRKNIMGSSILSIGQSALNAAQIGVATTGHNIANASTAGYTRQVVEQGAVAPQDAGFAFVGKGTEVTSVSRVYNQFLTNQVLSAQTSSSQLSAFNTQITQVDNLLADPNAGLSPALQDFFSSIQGVSADPNSSASRQALLSSGESLSSRFQTLSGQISDVRQSLNGQIGASISNINVYASQIAKLNDAIEKAQAGGSKTANDLLDQRDQAVFQLSKEVKVSVVQQGDSYNVFIGSGQPLVVGTKTSTLYAASSPTDPTRTEVGVRTASGLSTLLDESSLPGGALGGLFDFRSGTLDVAQNTLGRVAANLGSIFNAQHALGQTQTGALGGNFFNVGSPTVQASSNNSGASTAKLTAAITDASQLTVSDYRVQAVASSSAPIAYRVTRLSDGAVSNFDGATPPASATLTVDGVAFSVSGTSTAGDEFLVRPVATGASAFAVAITNKSDIALAAPVSSAATSTNLGTGAIGAASVGATTVLPSGFTLTYTANTSPTPSTLTGFPANVPVSITQGSPGTTVTYAAGTPVNYDPTQEATLSFGGVNAVIAAPTGAPPATIAIPGPNSTLTYNATNKTFSGFPIPLSITVTANGTSTVYPPGTPVPYTPGATFVFGGISVAISGAPADGDTFKVAGNPTGFGDNRNALLLGKLQSANTLDGGTTNFQGAYSQLVSNVGSKAHEIQATSAAADSLLAQSVASQQSESGVNLDEEAANLLRYQQAYQAAGKLIQTASTLFGVLLSLGGN
jgi:flagellar hook-associated protein 1 FlgK